MISFRYKVDAGRTVFRSNRRGNLLPISINQLTRTSKGPEHVPKILEQWRKVAPAQPWRISLLRQGYLKLTTPDLLSGIELNSIDQVHFLRDALLSILREETVPEGGNFPDIRLDERKIIPGRDGKNAVFGLIYELYIQRAQDLCYRRGILDRSNIDDVVQESFLMLLHYGIHNFDPSLGEFSAYFMGIVFGEAVKYQKKRGKLPISESALGGEEQSIHLAVDVSFVPGETLAAKEEIAPTLGLVMEPGRLSELVESTLANLLSREEGKLLRLVRSGKSTEDITRLLQINPGAIRVRIHRARLNLTHALARCIAPLLPDTTQVFHILSYLVEPFRSLKDQAEPSAELRLEVGQIQRVHRLTAEIKIALEHFIQNGLSPMERGCICGFREGNHLSGIATTCGTEVGPARDAISRAQGKIKEFLSREVQKSASKELDAELTIKLLMEPFSRSTKAQFEPVPEARMRRLLRGVTRDLGTLEIPRRQLSGLVYNVFLTRLSSFDQAILLVYLEGLSLREAAEKLGMRWLSYKSALLKARARLRFALEEGVEQLVSDEEKSRLVVDLLMKPFFRVQRRQGVELDAAGTALQLAQLQVAFPSTDDEAALRAIWTQVFSNQLSPVDQALLLRYAEREKRQDIAAAMGLTVGSIDTLVYVARNKLEGWLVDAFKYKGDNADDAARKARLLMQPFYHKRRRQKP